MSALVHWPSSYEVISSSPTTFVFSTVSDQPQLCTLPSKETESNQPGQFKEKIESILCSKKKETSLHTKALFQNTKQQQFYTNLWFQKKKKKDKTMIVQKKSLKELSISSTASLMIHSQQPLFLFFMTFLQVHFQLN